MLYLIYLLTLMVLINFCNSFLILNHRVKIFQSSSPPFFKRNSQTFQSEVAKLRALPDISTSFVSVGDFAAEIVQKTVGTEVYTPIFQAGIFLFASGLLSALVAAFIVAKSNTWEELSQELEEGKLSQLIDYYELNRLKNIETDKADKIVLKNEPKLNESNNNNEVISVKSKLYDQLDI